MIVDNQWVFTGSDNFSYSSMPSDPKGNGTAGERGALIITNAPDVVAYTSRLVNNDTDVSKYADLVRYPALGTPPPAYTPPPADDMTGYTPVKPTPLVVTETESFEIIQAPDNALRETDSLIGMVNKAGAGDEVMVEQQYERKYWETSVTDGPNPRLEAYIAAARRGANVRILLDGFFEGADCSSATHNPATVAYVNGLGLPNLQAKVGEPALGGPVGSGSPTTGNIHNKMVLVMASGQGYAHLTSINGSLNSSKNNREYGVHVASNAAYNYYKDVFDYDWGVGFLPCGATPTATATATGTQTPFTSTPTSTAVPTFPCNSLINSDLETGSLAPWYTTTPGVTAAVDNSVAHSGLYSVAVTHAFTATNGGSQGIQQDVTGIVAGQAYPLQGYVYRPDNNIQSARVRVAWYSCADFSCGQLSTVDVFAGNRGVAGWQYFSGTVTAPAGAVAARYRLLFFNANPVSSTINFDDVEFACTPATPATTPTFTPVATATDTPTATYTTTPTPGIQLIGHVTYQGIAQPSVRNVQAITLTLCLGGTPQDFVQNTDSQGFFTVTLVTGPGNYNYLVKSYKNLGNAGTVGLANGTSNVEFGTLGAGDTDNNNLVNTVDFNRLKTAFGTASNPSTDFNNDGITNTTDFGLQRNNFGTAGQDLTCP